jgi:3-isopropylmalate/(R)-2-methylmalate dehydratase small subunit
MNAITVHTGCAVALRRNDVDTDQIIPSEYCKRVTKTGYADGLFARWRADPEFVLNQPSAAGATVLLANPGFGTGSSREHAVWALRDWGFSAVVSARIGDIFRRNALHNGLLAVSVPDMLVSQMMDRVEADPAVAVTIDLQSLQVRCEELVGTFEIDQRARQLLMSGDDDIELTLRQEPEIAAYERGRPYWLPALAASGAGDR